jgi:uncharacterized protein YecE (DUF72 family)
MPQNSIRAFSYALDFGMGQIRIGVSGWTYPEWRGKFYPKGLVQKRELEYLAERMNSIEINGSFYSLQRPESYRKWAASTPDDFVFSLKGSKYITSLKKLSDVRIPVANFFASGPLVLGKKLGPIIWQFPAWLKYDRLKIDEFLQLLPRNFRQAAELATENTLRDDRKWLDTAARHKIRHAFEPRHPSFFTADFIQLLRKHNAALVIADTAGKFPYATDLTADFVYLRLHGATDLYASGYGEKELKDLAARINKWSAGKPSDNKGLIAKPWKEAVKRDVYVYFDNSMDGHAPFDAVRLTDLLSEQNKAGGHVKQGRRTK